MKDFRILEAILSVITDAELSTLRVRACDRYVKSILDGSDTIDRDRSTLYYIARATDERKNTRTAFPDGMNQAKRIDQIVKRQSGEK